MRKSVIIPLLLSAMFFACEQGPGKGGTSSITGVVYVQDYNKELTIKVGEPYPAQDLEVYLVYGEDEVYGDKFQTGFDGKYKFEFLQEGSYKVYALSKTLDNIFTNEKQAKFIDVDLGKDQELVVTDTILIID